MMAMARPPTAITNCLQALEKDRREMITSPIERRKHMLLKRGRYAFRYRFRNSAVAMKNVTSCTIEKKM